MAGLVPSSCGDPFEMPAACQHWWGDGRTLSILNIGVVALDSVASPTVPRYLRTSSPPLADIDSVEW